MDCQLRSVSNIYQTGKAKTGKENDINPLYLVLGTILKFYTSVAKELKQRVRTFWGLTPTIVEVTRGKLVGGLFTPHLEYG